MTNAIRDKNGHELKIDDTKNYQKLPESWQNIIQKLSKSCTLFRMKPLWLLCTSTESSSSGSGAAKASAASALCMGNSKWNGLSIISSDSAKSLLLRPREAALAHLNYKVLIFQRIRCPCPPWKKNESESCYRWDWLEFKISKCERSKAKFEVWAVIKCIRV